MNAVLLGAALASGACIQETPEDDVAIPDDLPGTCLSAGGYCGGRTPCCAGLICKGSRCSSDTACYGVGQGCRSSADCCGVITCVQGVCKDSTTCHQAGQRCTGSADCCGATLCRDGTCR